MFPRYCASCFTRHEDRTQALCFACRDELHELRLEEPGEILSCFRYRGVLRQLVLRAKVQGDHRAVSLLTGLVLAHPLVETWAKSCEVLMPSPSSLWGRARGRLDLAALIAGELGKVYGRVVRAAPSELQWRILKRALKPRDQREPLVAGPALDETSEGGPRIGLFDDVVTTGQTIAWTRAALPRGSDVRALTLASARE